MSIARLLLLFVFFMPLLHAQSSAGKSGGSSEGVGFAIESEMLTYRAVEANSEAVACDLAAYLYKASVTFEDDGSKEKDHGGRKCGVKPTNTGERLGVVLLPFDQTLADAFQVWRADMVIMGDLIKRSPKSCVETRGQGASGAASIAGAAAALTPAGAAFTLSQGVLGAFAQQTEVSAVRGTVEDQAFMDSTSRQLNVLGIPVLMPGTYRPSSLTGIDGDKSPFLREFRTFLDKRECVARQAADATNSADDKSLPGLKSDMESFFSALTGTPAATQKSSSGSGGGGEGAQASARTIGLTDILAIDGLAEQLGMGADATQKSSQWSHVLLLKALESGGTVTRTSNILGTRIHYNGGAVGTFALFDFDGKLDCSGNVFDFGGSVPAKHIERDLRHYTPDLESQILFQRGSCSTR